MGFITAEIISSGAGTHHVTRTGHPQGIPFFGRRRRKSQDWGDYHFGVIQQRNRGVLQANARSRSVALEFKLCVVAQAIMACPASFEVDLPLTIALDMAKG